MVANCVQIANAAHMRNNNFVFKSQVSRGAEFRFAIEGKASMQTCRRTTTSHALQRWLVMAGVGRIIFFDQCVFGAPTPKATQFIARDELLSTHLSPRFIESFCSHPPAGTHNSIVGKAAYGAAYRAHAAYVVLHKRNERCAGRMDPCASYYQRPLPYYATQGGDRDRQRRRRHAQSLQH
eukprot:6189174-Pleurochrysis_carterae.AAC.3